MKVRLAATLAIAIFLMSTIAIATPAYANPEKWLVYYREPALHPSPRSFTALPDGLGQFQFPDANAPQYVSYLRIGYTDTLADSNTITATFNVVVTNDAAFAGRGGSTNTFVRLYFQANLPASTTPTCAGPGYNEYNYWWSEPTDASVVGVYYFTGSYAQITLSVPIEGQHWHSMCGQQGTEGPGAAGFNSALANVIVVGLSFGSSGGSWASGVGVSSGTATFELVSYKID